MKKTNRNRHHRRRRLLVWHTTRAFLIGYFVKVIETIPDPPYFTAKLADVTLTEEERAQRVAVPIVFVQVKAPPMPKYNPLPKAIEFANEMIVRRPR